MAKDYYAILGVPRNASEDAIKKAYRKLAMQYHPDRNPGKEQWANERFKEINEAYGVLGNADKRAQYDRFGTVGNVGDIFGSDSTRATFEDLMREFSGAGLGFDFLDGVFGGGRSSSAHGRPGGRRGRRMRFEYAPGATIDLDEIIRQAQGGGRKQNVRYELTITGDEAAAGTRKMLTRKGRRLEVKIPAGVKTGSTIRLSNARQVTDGQPGDILVQVKVKK